MAKKLVKGKTSSGFKYEVNPAMIHNAEFLELFADVQNGNSMQSFALMEMALGKEQKKALYEHLRNDEGMVPVEDLTQEIAEIFEKLGEDDETKN